MKYKLLNILLLLLFLFAGFILYKFRRADRVLIAVDRDLDAFERSLGQPSPGENLSQNHLNKGKFDPNRDKLADIPKKDDVTQKAGTVSIVLEGFKRHVWGRIKDYLSTKKTETTAGINSEEFASSLLSNSDLKKKINVFGVNQN